MKLIVLLFLLPLGLVAAGAAAPAIVGSWDGIGVSQNGMQTYWILTVRQSGDQLAGSLRSKGEDVEIALLEPKFDGKRFTFKIRINATEVVDVDLKWGGDRLNGRFAGKDSGTGTFEATRAVDVSGTWSGEWENGPDGGAAPHFMVLKQDGGKVTGTAGPREEQQIAIQNGTFADGRLQFNVTIPGGGPVIRFDFQVTGDAMQGQASVTSQGAEQKLKLSAKRM